MLAGKIYRTGDAETASRFSAARRLLEAYNATPEDALDQRAAILKTAFVAFGSAIIRSPVIWEFGHVAIGEACFFNYDCIFLDSALVSVGSYVAVGPRVTFATATHPLPWDERALRDENGALLHGAMVRALPIVVEDHAWLGASVTILPGVTIGARSTIGAGSVVTRSIPADVVAAGNPCRVIRAITPSDIAARALP